MDQRRWRGIGAAARLVFAVAKDDSPDAPKKLLPDGDYARKSTISPRAKTVIFVKQDTEKYGGNAKKAEALEDSINTLDVNSNIYSVFVAAAKS